MFTKVTKDWNLLVPPGAPVFCPSSFALPSSGGFYLNSFVSSEFVTGCPLSGGSTSLLCLSERGGRQPAEAMGCAAVSLAGAIQWCSL